MRDLDEGQWLVTQLDQFIATFYLPLPEPLGLENGQHFETYLPPNNEAIRILAESNLDLAYQSLDDGPNQRLIVQSANERQRPTDKPEIWYNKYTLSTSLLIHEVAADPFARSGIDAALVVAKATAGQRFELREQLTTLAHRSISVEERISEAAIEGVGAVTVVEAAVPLRLIGGLPDLDDVLRDEEYVLGNAPVDTLLDLWPFIDSGTTEVPLTDLLPRLHSALAVAIKDVRAIQKAYYAVTRHPVTALTQNRLPHLVPLVLRRLRDVGDSDRTHIGAIEVNRNVWSLMRPVRLSAEQMSDLNAARSQVDSGAFNSYLDLYRDADSAMRQQGDTRSAALLFALSAESLLDEVLLHLKWEEAQTPEQAAASWIDGLDTRVKREYSSRLGGPWDPKGAGTIGLWTRHVADLRNRIVHGAYIPSSAEAQLARETVDSLLKFLGDQLASQPVLRKYPRTALALLGNAGLERRGAYSRRLRELQDSHTEPIWADTFRRWKEAHSRVRRDSAGSERRPDRSRSFLLSVMHPDGTTSWCLHDPDAHLAAQVNLDVDRLPPEQRASVEQVRSRYLAEEQVEAASIALLDQPTGVTQIGEWREEYHSVPLAGVMVDKSDFSQ
jgi:hypothetical protein